MFLRRNLFLQDVKGAAAIEFAAVALPLLLSIFFVFCSGWVIYLNQALDSATQRIAREIMLGHVQNGGASDLGAFKQRYVCPNLPPALNCGDTIVNLYRPVNDASGKSGITPFVLADATGLKMPTLSSDAGTFDLGKQGDYQYLLIVYPYTIFPSDLARVFGASATYNGQPAYLMTATAVFRNEQY